MKQSNQQRSPATKVAIAIAVVVLVAALSTLIQQWLLGKTNVAITSAVVAVSTFSMWRSFWATTK
ncbi:MAG: hypothetical protein ACREEM_04375 [Blastocatellia bacterium]